MYLITDDKHHLEMHAIHVTTNNNQPHTL